jgi:hypothetical protein
MTEYTSSIYSIGYMLLISGQGRVGGGDKRGIQLLTCSQASGVEIFKGYSKFLTCFDFL